MKITALVEKNDNNFYTISIQEPVSGCYFGGYGYSVVAAKEDFLLSIKEQLSIAAEDGSDLPRPEDIEIDYQYDIPSFFNAFDWINVSAFAKMAGINESKMRAYKSGLSAASEKTVNKILSTIKDLGAALSAASL